MNPQLEDVASARRSFIEEAQAIMRPRHLARHWHLAPAEQPHIREGVVGARNGRVVTKAVRPATW